MKKRNGTILLALVVLAAFTSCDKTETDNQKPVIMVVEPAEDEPVLPGSGLHFEVQLSDNEALASYKVNIHGAFDGHSHNAAAGRLRNESAIAGENGIKTRAVTVSESVAFERTWLESDFIALGETPIAGLKQATVAHQHMVIPETVNGQPLREGHYHFIVYCTDQSGQESFVAHEIFISYDPEGHEH